MKGDSREQDPIVAFPVSMEISCIFSDGPV